MDQQATKGDEAWTDEEEKELLMLVNDEEYRKVRWSRHAERRFCITISQAALSLPRPSV